MICEECKAEFDYDVENENHVLLPVCWDCYLEDYYANQEVK